MGVTNSDPRGRGRDGRGAAQDHHPVRSGAGLWPGKERQAGSPTSLRTAPVALATMFERKKRGVRTILCNKTAG